MSENGKTKVGVYLCHCGGNISDHVNIDELQEKSSGLEGVEVCRQNSFMCSDPGQELIIQDIKEGKVDRVVVASCAPALHETTFRGALTRAGLNPFLYEHANIREQVSWVHHGPGATEKAAGLVAAAVAKAERLKSLEPIKVNAEDHATVVGGGPAGMKAALELADLGIRVTLLERSPFLGGNLARLERLFPTGESARELLEGLVAQVMAHQGIEVITCAEVAGVDGYVGNFNLKVLRQPPKEQTHLEYLEMTKRMDLGSGGLVPFAGVFVDWPPDKAEETGLKTGAIVIATGFESYQPKAGEYGYGDPKVVTLRDFIQLMSGVEGQGGALKLDGRSIGSVAFIHCVGSRHIPGVIEPSEGPVNEYCSRTCCTATLQASKDLKKRFPETAVFELYRDIRTYGRGHEEFYLEASRNGVLFIRFNPDSPPEVSLNEGQGNLGIKVKDTTLANEELALEVDLVVLATGMEPGQAESLAEMLKLPVGADRFLLEVHPKLRPVEPSVSGVFLAGTCQAPMDITEACSAAGAAAVKAGAILQRGFVELDPFVARVDPELCKGHGACVEACLSEGALFFRGEGEDKKQVEVNPALCLGCGVCTAACPEGAIQVDGWTLGQYQAMVKAITQGKCTAGE